MRILGKKGLLTEQLKGLGALSAAERPAAGQQINDAKTSIQAALEMHRIRLEQAALEKELAKGTIDVTLPGPRSGIRQRASGDAHAAAHRADLWSGGIPGGIGTGGRRRLS